MSEVMMPLFRLHLLHAVHEMRPIDTDAGLHLYVGHTDVLYKNS